MGHLQRLLLTRFPHGRRRRHPLRSVFDALFSVLRTGYPWRCLPSNFLRLADPCIQGGKV